MPTPTASAETLQNFSKVCEILDKFDRQPSKIIPILQAVQEEYRYLPEEIMTFVATSLGTSPARVFGIATFYSHFSLEPKGKYIIKVCDGTACHVKGSSGLIETIQRELKLTEKNHTTEDLLFTLETVSCLGACGLAPAVVINEKVFGQVSKQRMKKLISEYKAMEALRPE
ncbi:NAD(P)H-dependent oxidoreductase subunit E [Oceanispirochaeta sp.]|uniref:NADH-quinone oxidoreductase subunit NuoE family protein n=1 Tax=Oceanispirochaeta sp. TaxID=2035350 RepID=UPI0026016F8B|nr:NAD(P)H-dependent oxidoreductase subunit E [Oceanispirochaeta sp.]MDA3957482.1 NAD(P)H-dependent oxidoreductase subunit E [Oceanispirochaeta sp.]